MGAADLILPFDREDPVFARGVEVGMIWKLLDLGVPLTTLAHEENAEMLLRMAEARGVMLSVRDAGGPWMEATFR